MLMYLIRPIVRFSLWLFFRKIEIRGEDQIVLGRPVIFVANHPNVLLDVLLLGRFVPGDMPRFIGKSTLFKNPLYAWILGSLGAISVARSQDRGSKMSSNRSMLQAASKTLKEGGSLALFPEGVSHSHPRIRKLKTGTAHIALRAGGESDGREDVGIVPVGITYSDPAMFRSGVILHFGKPIEVSDFLETYRENRNEAQTQLTSCIQERLIQLTRHIESQNLESVVNHLSSIFTETLVAELPDSEELSKVLRAQQEMIRAVTYFSDTDPDLVQSFSGRLTLHYRKLARFRLDESDFQASGFQPGKILLGIIFALPAGFGLVANAIPYYLPRLIARNYRHEAEMMATVKLVTGAVLFPLYYGFVFAVLTYFLGPYLALILAALLPVSGFLSLFYDEGVWRPLRVIRKITPGARNYLKRLSQERVDLLEDLNRLKSRFQQETDKG